MIRATILTLALLASTAQAQTVILYARADAAAADRVRQLVGLHDEVLIDRQIQPGAPWRQVMAVAITQSRTVLVLWSRRAARSSELATEWRLAATAGVRLVPVLLDDTPMPAELGGRQAIDWR